MSDVVLPFPPSEDADPSSARAARMHALVTQHFDFIWRSLRGLGVPAESADDEAQRVFMIVAQKLDGVVVGAERAFLFSTALGVASNARRAVARRREVRGEQLFDRIEDPAPNGERLLELKERRALLDQVLAEMPDDLRTIFVLFVLEGMPAPEIAELIGIPLGTVASRVRRAREAFHAISKRLQARLAGPNTKGRTP
jgi:RNA polymerase sigma-70 factor (ECF subfamily)